MSVAKNTSYLTLSYIAQKVLSLVYFVMIARLIGVEDLGKYSFALAFTTLFAVFIDVGLTQVLIRDVAQSPDKARSSIGSIFAIKLVMGAFVYGVVVFAINMLGYPAVTKSLVYLSGIIMVLDSLTLSIWGVFRGHQRLQYESLSIVVNQIIIIAAGFTILAMRLPLLYLMVPFILGSVWSLSFALVMMKRKLGLGITLHWEGSAAYHLLKDSLPFALLGIFTRVYGNIDSVMLSLAKGDIAVGLYSTALKIPFALQFIPASFAAAIFPAFSNYFISDKEQLRRSFEQSMKFLAIVVMPISLGIMSIAPEVMLTVFGPDFAPAILPLQVLVTGLVFVFLNFPLGSLMNGSHNHVTNTKLVGLTMTINIILNLIMIPLWSFTGAAIAFVMCHSFLFISGLFVGRRIIPYDWKYLGITLSKTVVSALVMAGAIVLGKQWIPWYAMIPVGAVVYGVVLFVIRGFTQEDIQYFIQSFRKKNA